MATMMAIIATATSWAQTSYGIKIDGVEITSANYQNITSANGFSAVTSEQGSVTYDPATNTLTLNGALIDAMSDVGLELPEGVNVVLQGENNSINAMYMGGTGEPKIIAVNGNCTISGNGKINCSIDYGNGIYLASNSTLTIKDCTVNVSANGDAGYDNGMGYAIRSEGGTPGALVVDHARVFALSGTIYGCIRYISSLTLNGCEITDNKGTPLSFDSSVQAVWASDGIAKGQVIIDIIPVPYAVYDGQGTMTFFYDKQKNKRGGTVFDVEPNAESQEWKDKSSITIVDFDESFASYGGMTSLQGFFYDLENLKEIRNLSRLVTSGVTSMNGMFYYCSSLEELDLTGFDTSCVTDMKFMFYFCGNLKKIVVGSKWNTESLPSDGSEFMFSGCTSLVGSQGTAYDANHSNATYAHIDHGESDPGYLTGVKEAYAVRKYLSANSNPEQIIPLDWQTLTFYYDNQKSEWGQKEETHQYDNGYIKYRYVVYDIEGKEWTNNSNGSKITFVVFDDSFANYHGLTDMSYFFGNLKELSSINGLQNLNTENVTTMNAMFYQCEDLSSLDLRHLNTENVTVMSDMFNGCSSLSFIRCNDNWQRNGLVSTDMFLECTNLKSYDPSKTDAAMANSEGYFTADEAYAVLDAEGTLTFYYDNGKEFMQALQPNYSYFSFTGTEWVGPNGIKWNDGSNPVRQYIKKVAFDDSFALYHGLVTTEKMFYGLYNLESIEGMENLNTENVTCMDEMFWCCMNLKQIDLSHFDTSKVTSMMGMFGDCSGLQELDVSSFNTAKVTDMRKMFFTCSFLTTIYCKTDWKLIAENNGITLQSADMFKDCISLKGGMGTAYSEQCTDANYAHPDNVSSPGFFTCTVEKGNLNDDENIDEVDVEILTDAILGKIAINADLIAKGDMNYDGALTIADVTLLVDAILKQE